MKLYEIDRAIDELANPETGEISDYEAFENLAMQREAKIEGMALAVKNFSAEADAIAAEIKSLQERKKTAENKAKSLKAYLLTILNGEKFSTGKVAVSYRKSKAVQIDEGFIDWARESFHEDLLTWSEPEPSKTAIKEWLAKGHSCECARMIENTSIQIK